MIKNENDFTDYLNDKDYYFDNNVIENFLLSIKTKQLIIISGKTGTGKTTLIRSYLDYISHDTTDKTIKSTFKLGKTATSKAFAFIRDDATPIYPMSPYENECYISVNGIKVKTKLNVLTRISFKPDENPDFMRFLEDPDKNKNDKINFELILNQKDQSFFEIIQANKYSLNETMLNEEDEKVFKEMISKASDDITHPYFLILENMNNSFFNILYNIQKSHELNHGKIPSNLIIIGELNNNAVSKIPLRIMDYVNVINLETITPMDYLNSKISKLNGNTKYLMEYTHDTITINDIKEVFQKIKINDDMPLWKVLYSELNELFNILKEANLEFGFRLMNNILKYMYCAWKYEDKPEKFYNWEYYFDFEILQKILPRINGSDKKIEYVLNDLKKFCTKDYEYINSYNKIDKMITNINNGFNSYFD